MRRIDFKTMVNRLPLAVIRSDATGTIIFANPAAEKIFGDNLVGKDAASLYSSNAGQPSVTPRSVKSALTNSPESQVTNLTVPLRVADGSLQEMLCSFSWNREDDTVDGLITPGVTELHRAIARIAESMVKSSKLESTLKVITEEALRLCKARRAYIKLHDPNRDVLIFNALSSTNRREIVSDTYSDAKRGMTGYVFRKRHLYRSGDVRREPPERYHVVFPDTVSEVVAPLLFEEQHEQRCYGVICVDGTRPNQFGVETDEILTTLSKHAAIAIAQAKLIHEVRTSYELILSEIRYTRDAIGAGNLLHDGKNMVRDVIHEIEAIQKELSDAPHSKKKAKELQVRLDGLRDLRDLMRELLIKLRAPSKLGRRSDNTGPADLCEIARRVINIIPLGDAKIEIRWEAERQMPYLAFGEPTRILLVLYNLVTNAVTAIRRSEYPGKISIRISNTPNREGFRRMQIEDDGPGLTKDVLNFIRGGEEYIGAPGGSGVGLLTVRETIKELGGTIEVDSKFGRYTKFTIDLPGPKED